jgi:hypothetical protein
MKVGWELIEGGSCCIIGPTHGTEIVSGQVSAGVLEGGRNENFFKCRRFLKFSK